MLPSRAPAEKKSRRAAARPAGALSRARRWLGKLLGRPATPVASHGSGRSSTLDRAELEQVRAALADVLGQHPQARTVLRYVQALDHGLRKKGRHALDDLPVDVIRRALGQLETLVTDWSPAGLDLLRSKAAVAIASREAVEARRAAVRHGEGPDVEVEEASVTTFMRANEEWERSLTGAAPLDEAPIEPAPDAAGPSGNADGTSGRR